MKNLVFKRFMSARLLLTAIIALTAFSSVRAIDLQTTLDFSSNPWEMIIGNAADGTNVYPNITTGGKTNGCNIADKEWNGITFSGTNKFTSPSGVTKSNGSLYYPTLRYSTSYFEGKPHMLVSSGNSFTVTAPDGYKFTQVVYHYVWGGSYYYNGVYNTTIPEWSEGGTYTLSSNGENGTYASTNGVSSVTIYAMASRAMWISSIDFTLVSTGGPVATKYNVNMDSEMVGGTVEVSPSKKVEEGAEVTLSPKAESGYTYNAGSLTVTNDATGEAVSVSDNKFTMPASDVTVSASFTPIEYTITVVDPSGNGTASADKTTAHKGETVTLTATPNAGYELVGWMETNDYVEKFTNNTFIMPAMNVTINPIFAKPKHTVSIAKTGSGTVTLSSTSVSEDGYFRVIATPGTGYELESIVVTDDVTNEVIAIDEEVNGYQMPDHDVTVTVVFVKSTYTITIDGNITNGTVTANKSTAQYGDKVTLTATPADGYELKSWNVTSPSGSITVSNNQFTMPAGNVTVSATFGDDISWTFNGATFTPALNTPVESISEIEINYYGVYPIGSSVGGLDSNNGIADTNQKYATLTKGDETHRVKIDDSYLTTTLTLTVEDGPITTPGVWTLHFDAGLLASYYKPDYINTIPCKEMSYTFVIGSPEPTSGTINLVAKGVMPGVNNEGGMMAGVDLYFATFSSDKDVIIDADDNMFAVCPVGVEDGYISALPVDQSMAEVTDKKIMSEEGRVMGYYIPANTGVMVISMGNEATYYYVAESNNNMLSDIDPDGINMLHPASAPKTGDNKFYKLAYSDSSMKPSSLGFYYGAANGAAFTSREGSAYLAVPSNVASANGFRFVVDDNTTGINEIRNNADVKAIYNLNGQRVNNSVKGIMIKGGRKFINK